jgi:predicted permease
MTPPGSQLRYVARKLMRSPGFTFITVLTLAVGIGANTAIFSVVNGVLLRPLPFDNPDELVGLWHTAPGIGIDEFRQSETSYTLYRELNSSFVDIGLYDDRTVNLTGDRDPIRVQAASATSSFFRVLGVAPARGRAFAEEDDQTGNPQVVMLSDELWRSQFGSDPNILGRSLQLDGTGWEVVGIMPSGFTYPGQDTRLWIPHRIDPATLGRVSFGPDAVARLRPGVTLQAAEADLNRMLARLPEAYPSDLTAETMESAQMAAFANPLLEDVVGEVRQTLLILLGTVGFVLLIACANVANLFLVRAEGRQREIALRTALGAGRGDLIKYFLTESIVLGLLGGVVGLGLAYWGIAGLTALGPNIPRLDEIGLHGSVLAFTGLISLIAGLLFGVIPILRYRSPNVAATLKEGGRGSSAGRHSHRTRHALVISQVALALVLLIASGLMARSYWQLKDVNPGFDSDGVLTARVSLPGSAYQEAREIAGFYKRLLDDLKGLPGVSAAGAITNLPMTDGGNNSGLLLEDFPIEPGEIPPVVRTNFATPGYFAALGIPLRAGRTFERYGHEEPALSVVVNAALEQHFWPDQSALGKRVAMGMGDGEEPLWYTIVGVVGNVRDDGLAQDAVDMAYFPVVVMDEGEVEWASATMSIAIRTKGPPMLLAGPVRQAIWRLDPRLPVANLRTTADIISGSTARTSFTMLLLGIAAAVALLLGTVGIYGVISYVVSQRTQEIGVRMALGAKRSEVSGMVVRQGVMVSAAGVAIGLLGAFGLTRLMEGLVFGVSTTDPLTFAGVAAVLLCVSVVASYIPARRAAGVDPLEALRYE